jgi:hypothetical protein
MPYPLDGAGLGLEMAADPTEADIDARDLVRELVSSLHHLRHVDLDTVGTALWSS